MSRGNPFVSLGVSAVLLGVAAFSGRDGKKDARIRDVTIEQSREWLIDNLTELGTTPTGVRLVTIPELWAVAQDELDFTLREFQRRLLNHERRGDIELQIHDAPSKLSKADREIGIEVKARGGLLFFVSLPK